MNRILLALLFACPAQAFAQAIDAPGADGFLHRWLLLEPLPVSNQLGESMVRAELKQAGAPAAAAPLPHAGSSVRSGDRTLNWHRVDTADYNVNLYHFAHQLGLPTSNVLFQLVTVIDAPHELDNVRLAIGSNSASVWWLDGVEVIGIFNERQTVIDDGVSKRLTLSRGRHLIQAVVVNAGGATDFTARFLDENGNPVTGFVLALDR